MRKITLLVALLPILFLVSCSNNTMSEDTAVIEGVDISVRAISGEIQTKTAVQSNGTSIYWTPGDAINVFYGSGSAGKFTANSLTEPGSYAEFNGTLGVVTGANETGGGSRKFWGVYPYNSANSCDGSSVTMTIPSSQAALAGTFANKLNPTVACTPGLDMVFYNVGSWFIFSVTQEGVLSATLTGNNNEDLVGKVNVTMDSNDRPACTVLEGEKSITMRAPEGGFVPGELYYMVLIPQTLEQGYTLTLRKKDAKAVCVVNKSAQFARSYYRRKLNADDGLTYEAVTPNPDNIVFADEKIKAKLVAAFDTNEDGEISYAEAAAVTSIEGVFGAIKTYKSFDEFQFFTGVTSIPDNMFSDWNLLTSITLPASIQKIGQYAFCRNVKLSSIQLSENLLTIGDSAFNDCSSLSEVVIPENVTSIGRYAFGGCSNLTSVMIPENLTKVEEGVFFGCSGLTSVVIPENVTSIGSQAFGGCSNLTSVMIPDYVTAIGSGAFRDCRSLETIVIPEGITRLNSGTFQGCTSLTYLTIPESVTYIEAYAFYGCTSITSIVIPANVISIETSAFASCSNLSSISIYANVINKLGSSAFFDIADNIDITAICLSKEMINSCFNANSISYTMLDGVTSIRDSGFSGIDMLTSIYLPGSVVSIGEYAFSHCSNLETIVIGEGVSIINRGAFRNCTSLTSIVIPESVTVIQINAFENCTGLVSVTLPESISWIRSYTFQGCTSLTYLTIPESVTYIQTYAFYGCTGLVSVIVPESVTDMTNAFENCSGLSSVTIYATTPPQISGCFNNTNNCPIYVPSSSVDAYKSSWSHLASRIQAIPE